MSRFPYPPPEWAGTAVLILSAAVAVLLVTLGLSEYFTQGRVTQAETTLLSTIAGAAIGVVATYVGTRRGKGPPDE